MAVSTSLGSWTSQYAGAPLNLSGYNLNFSDEFNTLSVGASNASPSAYNWFAPVRPGFGAATFMGPGASPSPFSVSGGALTITMQYVNTGWQSGLMQTQNSAGQGYSQEYGYFEMRAKFPAGAGSWPAFWLLSADPTKTRAEVDVIEAYGKDLKGYHSAVHFTPAPGDTSLAQKVDLSDYTGLPSSMFDGQFHTYGVKIDPNWITIYYDRVEIDRYPANAYVATPMYMVVDLAMNNAEVAQAVGPYKMSVDYVRAYADPTYTGLVLNGTANGDNMTGSKWGDTINGGAGADTMTGGQGDDVYYVDNVGDRVIEASGGGNDTVYSSVSFNTAGQYIENVILTGSAAINATGNSLNNSLAGNSANNVLDGGAGADTMAGGQGNDTYYVDNVGDKVIEANNAGTDQVYASVSFNAGGQYIENVTLTGSSAINATGNSLANILIGNSAANSISGAAGADTIDGGLGNDTLTGGADQDTFVFDTALGPNNVDVITDFNVTDDTIRLDHRIFTALPVGALPASLFDKGAAALQADDRIVYNSATGALSYDPDGTGPLAPVKFAQLTPGLALSYHDFIVA